MDEEYVQEHNLTGGIVSPVGGGLAESFMAAYSHFAQRCRVTPDTSLLWLRSSTAAASAYERRT